MNNNTLVSPLLGFLGAVIVALIGALVAVKRNNRELAIKAEELAIQAKELAVRVEELAIQAEKNRGDHLIAEWQQWRDDCTYLRKEVQDLRAEVRGLRDEVERLDIDNGAVRQQRDEALAESAKWQAKYNEEHTIRNIFAHLYDSVQAGRIPDAVMLATINQQLTEAGFLTPRPPKA